MEFGDWVIVAGVGAGVGWWLFRGDVSGWRQGLRDPAQSAAIILSLAVYVLLLWVWVAVDDEVSGLIEMFAGIGALMAAIVVLYGLRMLIVALVRLIRER